MRTLVVFGATGKTGLEVIRRAAAEGWAVRAFCRPGSTGRIATSGVERIEGSLDSAEDVRRALRGSEVTVIVFGPRRAAGSSEVPFCARGTRAVIDGMKDLGLRRLICQTGAMVGADYPNRGSFYEGLRKKYAAASPALASDRDEQERTVIGSGLDWTVVKPPRISEGRGKGRWKAAPDLRLGLLSAIPVSDLVAFIVREIDAKEHVRRCVFVSA